MDIFKIVGFVLAALFFVLFFKEKRNDIAVLISLMVGILIFTFCLKQLNEIIEFLRTLSEQANIEAVYFGIILKILAISYLSSFASDICKDAGCVSLSSKVEFAGKLFILILALPILRAVLDSILQIL